MFRDKYFNHENIYIFSLALLVVSLPLSMFLLSVSQIALLVNWLLEGDFKRKWHVLKSRKSLPVFLSLYLIHLIWLFNTSDFSYAFHDLRVKLPLLVLPLVIGTSKQVSQLQFRIILSAFLMAVVVSSIISMLVLVGMLPYQFDDIRQISLFISHIRFALLIVLAVFIGIWYVINDEKTSAKLTYGMAVLWLVAFLFILRSMTGVVAFVITLLLLIFYVSIRQVNKRVKIGLWTGILLITASMFFYIYNAWQAFYDVDPVNPEELEQFTAQGNPYTHNLSGKDIENGQYVWLYVSEDELRESWNQVSEIPYDSLDRKGHHIKYTLIRYLTSRGFRKDAEGVAKLSGDDIEAIESGIANHIFKDTRFGIYPRVYSIIWQIDQYKKGRNPSGHSVTQRYIYLKTAFEIIGDHFWTGTGTGDVRNAFNEAYDKSESQLSVKWRLRAHNQFVTFFISFGIIGFLWSIIAIFYPLWYEKKYKDYFFMVFFIIAILSTINEDTLETHAGVSFFAFFFAFFLFRDNNSKMSLHENID